MATSKDDLILVSVDDHICEPADMFDAHVPERTATARRASSTNRTARSSGTTASIRGRNLGLNAVAGKPPEMFNVDPMRYEDMRPGCYDVARARARHVGRRAARGLELPELDRLLGPGAERRARPRREPRDDPGVQRLARRRVVRRVSRTASSRAGSCRCSTSTKPRPRCAGSPAKGCHAVTFSENPAGLGMPSIHSGAWDPLFAACCDDGHRAVLPRRFVVEVGVDRRPTRRRRCR